HARLAARASGCSRSSCNFLAATHLSKITPPLASRPSVMLDQRLTRWVFLSAFTGQGSTHAFVALAIRWCPDPHPEEDRGRLCRRKSLRQFLLYRSCYSRPTSLSTSSSRFFCSRNCC